MLQVHTNCDTIKVRPLDSRILYGDPASDECDPAGAASNRGGAIERFVKVIRQLDLTFDVHAKSGGELVQILPAEFGRFLKP